jgi:TfoX/Sxy family transcriptional regulator of competence genes
MAYDEGLAERIRGELAEQQGVQEKHMFGGLSFLLNGNMAVGVIKDDMVVRADPEQYDALLELPHACPMDFTGRPMKGWIYVAPDGLAEDADLRAWIGRGVAYAGSLPPK